MRPVDAIYDFYAEDLYDYCQTFLDPEASADALHDAILVALAWANRLEARDQYGLWLYAITRNECLRVLRRGGGAPPIAGAHSADRTPRRFYSTDDDRALGPLREVYDLIHRHAFDTREVATLLGVSASRAQSLIERSEELLGGNRTVIRPANAGPRAPLPRVLRSRVLASASQPSRVSYRGDLATPRLRNGYPVPLDRVDSYRRGRTRKVAGAAAALLVVVGAAFMVPTASRHDVVGLLGSSRPASDVTTPVETGVPSASPTPAGNRKNPPPNWKPLPQDPAKRPAGVGPISGVGGKCAEVLDTAGANASPVQLFQCTGRANQTWTVGSDGTLRAFNKCLSVRNGGTTDGSEMQLLPCTGAESQKWQHRDDGALVNPKSKRCLEAPTLNAADNTQLVIFRCSRADNQYWYLPS